MLRVFLSPIQASVEDRAVRGYPKSYQVILGYSNHFKIKFKVIHFIEELTVPKLATAVSQSLYSLQSQICAMKLFANCR